MRRAGLVTGTLGCAGVTASAGAQTSAAPPTPYVAPLSIELPTLPLHLLDLPPVQSPTGAHAAAATWADRIVLSGEWAHLGAGPIHRDAGRSMDATAGYDLGRISSRGGNALRVEVGWLRAARPAATAQGATAGISVGVTVPRTAGRLTLRPGLAVLGGWAESQGGEWYYDWRGVAGTSAAGQTGTVELARPVRSAAFGGGAALGAALNLGRGVSLTGALRPWMFGGSAAAPLHGVTTLVGAGVSVRPALWSHAASDDSRATRATAAGAAPTTVDARQAEVRP